MKNKAYFTKSLLTIFLFTNHIFINLKKYRKIHEKDLVKRLDSCKILINSYLKQDKVLN